MRRPLATAVGRAPAQRRALLQTALGSIAATSESTSGLGLGNGSRIVSLPGKEATIRGYSDVALLVIDEAARVDEDLYVAVRPMLAVSGGRLLAALNPRRATRLVLRGLAKRRALASRPGHRRRLPTDQRRVSRRGTTNDAARSSTPANTNAEFTDAIDSVFSHAHVMAALDPTLTPLYTEGW